MKRLCVGALVLMVVGCSRSATNPVVTTTPADGAVADSAWLADAVAAAQARQSVIAGHTLYSRDFVSDGSALNEQGCRNLAILADYYRVFPGQVNIERGDVSKGLYARRVNTVLQGMARAGIESSRMMVADAAPRGSDGAGDRMVLVQLRYQQQPGAVPGSRDRVPPGDLAASGMDVQP